MRLQFIGSGDAFGSGGRFNTCFHVEAAGANFLIDCGATSLVALKRLPIERSAIDLILLTHFHLDHFGGVPFFVLDAQLVAKRARPLTIAGPPGLPEWYDRLLAATFPGERKLPFELTLREVEIGARNMIGALTVTPFRVRHDDKAGPCLAYRIELEGKVICYSGDTEWTDSLLEAARGADLFICECYTFDKVVRAHLSLSTLRGKLPIIGAKRVILTHMSDDMLSRASETEFETASDGKMISL
ncbi:MAG TPA: MBL fold metallo-hydrolase [Pseudolabrys sp.]|jgi:ribonuclease BN (tRNA processing enzyme)|nr:MBL fold metallo-hydrolase [Pseudolabrys sp.]